MIIKKILNVLILLTVIIMFVFMMPGLVYAEEGVTTDPTNVEEETASENIVVDDTTPPEETTRPEETTAPDTIVEDDTALLVEEPAVEISLTTEEQTAIDNVINAVLNPIITTDKDDYYPGEIVIVKGNGWLPGETVRLTFDEVPYNPPVILYATADDEGDIYNTQYLIETHHLGATITLTAIGLRSGLTAKTVFTDAPRVASVNVGSQSPNPVNAGNNATYIISITRGGSGNYDAVLSITGLPAGATGSFSPNPVLIPNTPSGNTQTSTLTITTTSSTPDGSTTFTVRAERSGHSEDYATGNGTLIVQAAGIYPSITSQPVGGTRTVGESYTFAVTATGTTPLNYQWRKGGVNIGGATSSSYTISLVLTSDAGSYDVVVSNAFGSVTSNTAVLIVNKATPTITWANSADITYGTALGGTQLNATASVAGSFIYTPSAGTVLDAGDAQNLSVDFTPTDTANYNNTSKTVKINVNPKPLTPHITAGNKVYDGTTDATILTRTLTGVVGSDDVDLIGGIATFADKNVADNITVTTTGLSLSGADTGNYELSSTIATNAANITPRLLTVTADAKSKVYGDSDPVLTYQVTLGSLVTGDDFTGSLTRVAGEDVGDYAILQGTVALSANYTLTYVGAYLTINEKKKSLIITTAKVVNEEIPATTVDILEVAGLAYTGLNPFIPIGGIGIGISGIGLFVASLIRKKKK